MNALPPQHPLMRLWRAMRGALLFVLPLPLVLALFISLMRGDFTKTLIHLFSLALMYGAAAAARRGFAHEAAYQDQRYAAAPRLPLKTLAAILLSLGTWLCSYFAADQSLAFALLVAGLSFAGFYFAYGLDPRQDKALPAGSHGLNSDELVTTLAEAERKLSAIDATRRHLSNLELQQRVARIADMGREILGVIANDPRDMPRARKFLYVYLDGTQRVCEGYARTHQQAPSVELEDKFRNVLGTIEEVFAQQRQHLLANDVMDLDVQIEVLRTQLQHEGIH
jgi:5-bromo-4-chloroindolyl phosphate hydrolysis protein